MKSFSNRLLTVQIAWKELIHNSISSLLIIMVIAAICLPLLILTSLKEGYLDILKDNFYKSNQATRIDILATTTYMDEQKITEKLVGEFNSIEGVKAVVPTRTHKVYTFDEAGDGEEEGFDAVTTIPTDPDLARFGFSGQFGEQLAKDPKSIIMHKDDLKKLGYDSIPQVLPILVKRSSKANKKQEFIIDCNVVGIVSGGLTGKIYVTVPLDRELERFQLGLSAPALGLPADPSSEETLPQAQYTHCTLISRQPLYDLERNGVEIGGKKYQIQSMDDDSLIISNLFHYKIAPEKEGELLKDKDRSLIKSFLAAEDIHVLPATAPLNIKLNDISLNLSPSAILKDDMRHKYLLKKGRWLNPERGRFEIVVPDKALANSMTLPVKLAYPVGKDTVYFSIQGTVDANQGYIDYAILNHLKSLEEGKVKLSKNSQYFETTAENPYVNRYLMAGVHAKSIDDVLPLISYFRNDRKYEIHGSSEAKVKSIQQYTTLLNNFTLLISIAAILAGITALWVLMYEAIKRKKNQIGIMRAMGLSKSFITRIYLWQSLAYGLGGFFLSFLIFKLLVTNLLESALGRTILDIQNIEGNVFITPFSMILYFIAGILLVSIIAGRSAAQSVRNIDPAVILTD